VHITDLNHIEDLKNLESQTDLVKGGTANTNKLKKTICAFCVPCPDDPLPYDPYYPVNP
jgi:hypothetical protein